MSAAVVGAGLMGRWHAHELVRSGGRLAAVVDPDEGAGSGLASRYGALSAPSLAQALEGASVDVVHLCSPLETHAALVREAAAAGVHLLVEKPLAPDAETTRELLEVAERSGVALCPVHQYVFQEGTVAALGGLARIGPLVHVEATACSAGGRDGPVSLLDETAADILPHPLSVLERLLEHGVESLDWRGVRPGSGELRASRDGAPATVAISVSMNGRPPRNELRAIGTRGTVTLDFFHGYAAWERGGANRADKVLRPFAASASRGVAAATNLSRRALRWEPAYPGLRALIQRFYAAVRTGSPAPIEPAETLAVAEARDRILAGATR